MAQDVVRLRKKPLTQSYFHCHSSCFAEANLDAYHCYILSITFTPSSGGIVTLYTGPGPRVRSIFTNKLLKAVYGSPFSNYRNAASSGWGLELENTL